MTPSSHARPMLGIPGFCARKTPLSLGIGQIRGVGLEYLAPVDVRASHPRKAHFVMARTLIIEKSGRRRSRSDKGAQMKRQREETRLSIPRAGDQGENRSEGKWRRMDALSQMRRRQQSHARAESTRHGTAWGMMIVCVKLTKNARSKPGR